MLDPETMVLLGKLKILARKTGANIDLVKMSGDRSYAELTLKDLSNTDDPELVLIVIKLMNIYGLFEAPVDMAKAEEKPAAARYVGALR